MMTIPETSDFVEREIRIAASQEVIYAFFTDPAKMVQWKGTDAALDPRPGGIYRVNVTGRDVAKGEYVELVPFSRLVFTWGWENGPIAPGTSIIEISLIPDGAETVVRLRHSGLNAEAAEQHAEGWEHFLPRLAAAAEGRDPGIDPWTLDPA